MAFVTAAVAATAIGGGFVGLDDSLYVSTRPAPAGLTVRGIEYAFTSVNALYWHPLAWLSHEADAEIFGSNPAGHHLTSVVLHALTAGLLCFAFVRLGAGRLASAAGGLLWAVHPLRVESFAWVAERKDVLCAFFVVGTVILYLRYTERPTRMRYATWLCSGALALMSKPTAVVLPALLLLLDYWPLARARSLKTTLFEKLPLAVMAAAVMALTVLGQTHSGSTSHLSGVGLGVRAANAAVSYVRYLGKMVWPWDLACFYPYNPHPPAGLVALSALLLGVITLGAVLFRTRRPWLFVGWGWFVVGLLPNAGFVQAGRQSIADRFTEIPMMGIVIAVVWSAVEFARWKPEWRRAYLWATAGVLALLGVLTVRQIGYWRDSETLFRHAIAVDDSAYMRANLAETLLRQGKLDEAESDYRLAVRLSPGEFEYHNGLANFLLRKGDLPGASGEVGVAARLAPNNLSVAETAGLVQLRSGDTGGAMAQFDRAVQLGADQVGIAATLNDAGASLAGRGNPREAEALVRRAIDLNPALVQSRRNLVLVLMDQGRIDEARASLREAVRATGVQATYRDLMAELDAPSGATPSTGR